MNTKRVVWILAVLGALGLALGVGVVIGGGVVYALSRGGDRLPLSIAEGGDPGYGIVIAFVESEGPADKAGIVRGDILLELGGETIENSGDLVRILDQVEPDDAIELVVLHGDEERSFVVMPDERDGRAYLGLSPCGGYPVSLGSYQRSPGALVVEVTPDSPAEKAGLQPGDYIVAVDGQALDESDLADLIAGYEAGDTISLTIERPGEEASEISLTLETHPENEDLVYLGVQYIPSPGLGMWRGNVLPFEERDRFEFDELPFSFPESDVAGVVVQRVIEDSPALTAGIEEGDVITAIDGNPVESAQALVEVVAEHEPGDKIALTLIRSEEGEQEVEVTLGEHPEKSGKAYLGVWLGGFFRLQRYGDDEMPSPRRGWRWFIPPFGLPLDEEDMPRPHFEFYWPPDGGDNDAPSGDDTNRL